MSMSMPGRNPDKPVVVISPFYHWGDEFDEHDRAKLWRKRIKQVVEGLNYPNVSYVNGLDILGDLSFLSADGVHPNIIGVQQIAERMTAIFKKLLA